MSQIHDVLNILNAGGSALLHDDLSQNQCGYLLHPAGSITEQDICNLVNHAGGLTLAAISEERLKYLSLKPMLDKNPRSSFDLTVSVEARHGVTTGISASDRAKTLLTLATTEDPRRDLVTPGHIFPIAAKTGGVLVRHGFAEAAVDLMNLCELAPVCAMSHCLNEDGELADLDSIKKLSENHSYPLVSISELIEYRLTKQPILEQTAETSFEWVPESDLKIVCFKSNIDNSEHLAFKKTAKTKSDSKHAVVRVQSEKLFSDVIGVDSEHGRVGFEKAINALRDSDDNSIFVYIRHPKSKSLKNLSNAINGGVRESRISEHSQFRELGIGAQILRSLGVREITLLSNSERVYSGLEPFGIKIVDYRKY